MPLYDFRNKETGELFELSMKIADKEHYLRDNPNIEQVHVDIASIVDPVNIGVTRPDNGWGEVLQKVNEKTAGSTLKSHARYI